MKNMNQIRRSTMLLRSKYRSLLKFDSVLGFAASERTAIVNSSKKEIASSKDMVKNSWLGLGLNSKPQKCAITIFTLLEAVGFNAPEETSDWAGLLTMLGGMAAIVYLHKECVTKEREIFNIALKRIQDDAQVTGKIGSPITGYDPCLQRLQDPVLVNFKIRGPYGSGKVSVEMFKDKVHEQWKYTNLTVQTKKTSELILEPSHMPAPAPVA